jgi:hypothetical protein
MTATTGPDQPLADELTGYLLRLADLLGYDLDLDTLDPVCGHDPKQVLEWASAGTDHAALTYLRHLLAEPISFLQSQAEPGSGDAQLLADLLEHDRQLDQARDVASRRYATACARLRGSGLTWPRQPDQPAPPDGGDVEQFREFLDNISPEDFAD